MPDDDNAARLSLPESELPPEPVPMPGEATVTPIASRLGAAAGMGGGSGRRGRRACPASARTVRSSPTGHSAPTARSRTGPSGRQHADRATLTAPQPTGRRLTG